MILTAKKQKKIERDSRIVKTIEEEIKKGGMKSAIYIAVAKKYKLAYITVVNIYRNHLKNLKS